MKRYRAHKNNKSNMQQYRSLFYAKKHRAKIKNNTGSTFIRINLFGGTDKQMLQDLQEENLFYNYTYSLSHTYMLEIDRHQNADAHFHIWRTNGYSKISNTRSPAISLKSDQNSGLVYLYKERKNEAKPNDIQTKEITDFVEENRYLLFLMFNAFKHFKVKDFPEIDEEFLKSLFSRAELFALNQKYKNKYNTENDFSFFEK